jgi:integrase
MQLAFDERNQPLERSFIALAPCQQKPGDRSWCCGNARILRVFPTADSFHPPPISPNNVLRRWVFPACSTLGLPNATWLTFRRTYSSWAHANGVPGRVLADLMGHAKVDTSLNVYAQVIDGAKRSAAEKVSGELFTIVHCGPGALEPTP